MNPLPAIETTASFTVRWSGQDPGGPGIASSTIYVSDNGGTSVVWQNATSATSAIFNGVNGHTYGFYSVATDNAGNVQPTPTAAQTTTTVQVQKSSAATSSVNPLPAIETTASFTVRWSGQDFAGGFGIASYSVYVSDDGGPFTIWQSKTAATSATFDGVYGHNYGFYSVATDNGGNVQPTPTAAQTTTSVTQQIPPLTITSLHVETIKRGTGRKAKKETVLALYFSGALDAASADNASAYQLAPMIKVPAKGKGKHRTPPTIKLGPPVALTSADYSASDDSVTLTPRGKLNLAKPEQLTVVATLVNDALDRPIDGNDDGQPGGNYVAVISKSGVTVGARGT